jgi:hypothetical protein
VYVLIATILAVLCCLAWAAFLLNWLFWLGYHYAKGNTIRFSLDSDSDLISGPNTRIHLDGMFVLLALMMGGAISITASFAWPISIPCLIIFLFLHRSRKKNLRVKNIQSSLEGREGREGGFVI